LAIYLTLVVAGISLLGALIPQKQLPAYYEAHYKAWAVNILNLLSLTDVYNSWYFTGVLVFLVVVVLTCMIRRLPRVLVAFSRKVRPPAAAAGAGCCVEAGPAGRFPAVARGLKRLPFAWREAGGVLYGRRRPYAVLGEVLTHVGLLVIFLGAFLRGFGHREEFFIYQGYGVALPAAFGEGLELWADDVDEIVDGNTRKVVEYRTKVTLFRYGTEVASKEVEVNGPLRYGGLGIYQSNMIAAGARGLCLEAVKLKEGVKAGEYGRATFSWEMGGEGDDVTLALTEAAALGDTGLRLRYLDYFERFTADAAGFGDSGSDYNPAAFVHVVNDAGAVAPGLLFKLNPERSFTRTPAGFTARPLKITYRVDDGPWQAGRREYLFAAGSRIVVGDGGDVMEVALGEGEGRDLRYRFLEGVLRGRDGAKRLKFPFYENVSVDVAGSNYLFRFMGDKSAPVTGLTVARDPGLDFFYVGCILFTLGVAGASLLRFDELFAYVREGRVYIAGRSSKGSRLLRPAFDRWVAKVRGEL
jgi:hypothetical protein